MIIFKNDNQPFIFSLALPYVRFADIAANLKTDQDLS
jgi:hypothetical protein